MLGLCSYAVGSHPALAAVTGLRERRIVLHRSQFGESFSGIYWQDGQYVPEALLDVSRLFREPKNGAVKAIDPHLLDGLLALQRKLGTAEPFDVLSGFRQPHGGDTGAQAHLTSYHHVGKAADVRLPGRTSLQIFDAARELRIGGVGRYAGKTFVHVDTGAVRTWAWGFGKRGVTTSRNVHAAGETILPGLPKPARLARAAPPAPLSRPR